LRRGSKIALSLGVAAAGIGSEAGLLALGANPNIAKFGGKTGELVATAAAQQVQRLLPEHEAAELELAITLDAIDPTARARAFLRLLENTIAHAAASEQVTDEAVDRAEVQLARLERAAERAGNRSRELDGALQAVAGDLQAARATLAAAPTPAAQEALRDALDQCRQAWQAMQGERMGMYRIVAPGGVRLSTDDLQPPCAHGGRSGHRAVELAGAGGEVLGEGDQQRGGLGADPARGQQQAGPGADAPAPGVGEAGDQREGGVVGNLGPVANVHGGGGGPDAGQEDGRVAHDLVEGSGGKAAVEDARVALELGARVEGGQDLVALAADVVQVHADRVGVAASEAVAGAGREHILAGRGSVGVGAGHGVPSVGRQG
jgi:flagellar biosynthesis chaperone FliJ